ncbi:MAG: hypothetical protein Kow00105_13060 [Phycisphaeraceae bacterium]
MHTIKAITTAATAGALMLFITATPAQAGCGTCSSSCASSKESKHEHAHSHNIVELASEAGSFNTLLTAAKAAGLAETLMSDGPFTVFAPTDEAFAKLPAGTVETLLKPENKDQLRTILLYHVVPGEAPASEVVKSSLLKTAVPGKFLSVHTEPEGVMIDDAKVIKTDLKASNGIVHVIDTVVMPKDKPSIVDVASQAGSFNTLLAAAKAAGLAETLELDGPYTVFAPTDEAFSKLPAGTVESLLKPENKKQLQTVLLYHVIPGKLMAGDVIQNSTLSTAAGDPLTIKIKGETVHINNARILTTDLEAANGVVHVIDTVLLPESKSDH